VIIERAKEDDLHEIVAMRGEASEWLAKRGVDQWRQPWPDYDRMLERILGSIRAGETWMVRDARGANAATVALDEYADPRLWTEEERAEPALYLHRLIVRRQWAGLGEKVLNWACHRAGAQGKLWVRIDVWTDNKPLHDYYVQQGFLRVRTLRLSDYPSGALFQRRAVADGPYEQKECCQCPTAGRKETESWTS
jgi:hypothetical protein